MVSVWLKNGNHRIHTDGLMLGGGGGGGGDLYVESYKRRGTLGLICGGLIRKGAYTWTNKVLEVTRGPQPISFH